MARQPPSPEDEAARPMLDLAPALTRARLDPRARLGWNRGDQPSIFDLERMARPESGYIIVGD